MAMTADIRNTATRRWGVLVLLTLLGAAAGLAYALIRPPEYTAKAYLAVVAQNAGDSTAVSYAQAYSRIASQGDALQAAADASGGSASVQDLRRSVLAMASPDAPVIELTGTAGSPERAADLVNLVSNGLAKTANTHTGDTRMRLAPLSAAAPPADPTSPQLPLALAVGAAAGFVLGGLAFLGLGERKQPQPITERVPAEPTAVDPVVEAPSIDGNALQRLTSWRGRPPVDVMTRPATPDVRPVDGGSDMDLGAGHQHVELVAARQVEPENVPDVAPAAMQEHAAKNGDDDVKGDGDWNGYVNQGKPKGPTPKPRPRRRVASTGSSRRDGAD